jgi:hypothetical protein
MLINHGTPTIQLSVNKYNHPNSDGWGGSVLSAL